MARLRLRHIGYVLQTGGLLPFLSAGDNIAAPGRAKGMDAKAVDAGLKELAGRLGIGHLLGTLPGKLSIGERQRAAIARALLKNAPVLILDEATAYCDPDNEDELQKALSALARGKTVVVIAHRLRSIADADAILVIRDGELAASGSHAGLLAASNSLFLAF